MTPPTTRPARAALLAVILEAADRRLPLADRHAWAEKWTDIYIGWCCSPPFSCRRYNGDVCTCLCHAARAEAEAHDSI